MIAAGEGGGGRAQPDAAAGGRTGHCLGAPGTSTSHPSAFSSLGAARVGVTASCTRRGSRARAPPASEPGQGEAQERARLAEAGKGAREAEAPQPRGGSGGGGGGGGGERDPPAAVGLPGMCGHRRRSPPLSRG